MWILLYYINQYDQEGGYFVGVFNSYEECEDSVDHLGRREHDYSWYEATYSPIGVRLNPMDDKNTTGYIIRESLSDGN